MGDMYPNNIIKQTLKNEQSQLNGEVIKFSINGTGKLEC